MFGFYNYNKPGKGVNPRDPKQPRVPLFFELLFSKLGRLAKLNLLYILLMIPALLVTMLVMGIVASSLTDAAVPIYAEVLGIGKPDMSNAELVVSLAGFDAMARLVLTLWFAVFFGMGPATAGITYVLRNNAREEPTWLWSDTWRNLKSNFKQSLALWVIDLLVFVLMIVSFDFYSTVGTWGMIAKAILVFVTVLYLMLHIYVYQMMITFELPLKHIMKNSLILSLMNAPKTLLLLAILAFIHIALPVLIVFTNRAIFMTVFILLEVVFLLAASGFMTNFFIYPSMEKLIQRAQAEAEGDAAEEVGELTEAAEAAEAETEDETEAENEE